MFKEINKLICIGCLLVAISAASSGHFVTAGVMAAYPIFVSSVTLVDSIKRHGL